MARRFALSRPLAPGRDRTRLVMSTDREAAQRLPAARAALDDAKDAYRWAQRSVSSVRELRAAYDALTAAYQDALAAGAAAERVERGSAPELGRWRDEQQQHLLDAPAGVVLPGSVRPNSGAAYGPHIPGMGGDSASPVGAATERTWGVDIRDVLEGRPHRSSA